MTREMAMLLGLLLPVLCASGPQLTVSPFERFRLPLSTYFPGNAVSYTVTSTPHLPLVISPTKGLSLNATIPGDSGKQRSGIVLASLGSYFVEPTETGLAVFEVVSGGISLVWTEDLPGIGAIAAGSFSGNGFVFAVVNKTEIYAGGIDGKAGLEALALDLEGMAISMLETTGGDTAGYLFAAGLAGGVQQLVVYTYWPGGVSVCGNVTDFGGAELHIIGLRYSQRLFVLDQEFGLLVLLFDTKCGSMVLSQTGDIVEGSPVRLGGGGISPYISVHTDTGVYVIDALHLTVANFYPLTDSLIDPKDALSVVTPNRIVIAYLSSNGKLAVLVAKLGDIHVEWYQWVDGNDCGGALAFTALYEPGDETMDRGYFVHGVEGGLVSYRMTLGESYLEGWNVTSPGTIQLLVRSAFPQPSKHLNQISISVLPFQPSSLLYGSGVLASTTPTPLPPVTSLFANDTVTLSLPCSSYFSGPNIDQFAVDPTAAPGIDFAPIVLKDPYFHWLGDADLSQDWGGLIPVCQISESPLRFLAVNSSRIAVFELDPPSLAPIYIDSTEYSGTFNGCVSLGGLLYLSVTAEQPKGQSLLLSYDSASLRLLSTTSLPGACDRLKQSPSYLLCVSASQLTVCDYTIACVSLTAQGVIGANSPFQLYDAELILDTGATLVIADAANGLRTVDLDSLFEGATSVKYLEYLSQCNGPTQLLRSGDSLYVLSTNLTIYDLADYPNIAPIGITPISDFTSGAVESAATSHYLYVTDGDMYQVIDPAAASLISHQRARFPRNETASYLFLTTSNSDLVLSISETVLSTFEAVWPTTIVHCRLSGSVTAPASLSSSDVIRLTLYLNASSSCVDSSIVRNVTSEVRNQGYYLWVDPAAVSEVQVLPITDEKWVDLGNVVFGKRVGLIGEPSGVEGVAVEGGVTWTEIGEAGEGCGTMSSAGEGLVVLLCQDDLLVVARIDVSSSTPYFPVFQYQLTSVFPSTLPLSCSPPAALSTPSLLFLSLYCSQSSPVLSAVFPSLISLRLTPQDFTLLSVSISTAPSCFSRTAIFYSDSVLYTLGFTPASTAIFHLTSVVFLPQSTSIQYEKTVTQASFPAFRLNVVDIAATARDSALYLYISLADSHAIAVQASSDFSNITVVASRDMDAKQIIACGDRVLTLGNDAISVFDTWLSHHSTIYDYQFGLQTRFIGCFDAHTAIYALAVVESAGKLYLETIDFHCDVTSSIQTLTCCTDLAPTPPLFVSPGSVLYTNASTSTLFLAKVTPRAMHLTPVPTSYSQDYTVTASNDQKLTYSLSFLLNRTYSPLSPPSIEPVSSAGWWVWLLIGLFGLGIGGFVIVYYTVKRRKQRRNRAATVNISLNLMGRTESEQPVD